jgi:hypothetical protein
LIVAAALLLNTVVMGRSLNLYSFPGERGEIALAKDSAVLISAELLSMHEGHAPVSSILEERVSRMQFDIRRARRLDEIAHVLERGIVEIQSILTREEDTARRTAILSILEKDDSLVRYRGKASISISRESEDGDGLQVLDTEGLLTAPVLLELSGHPALQQPFLVVVEIDHGQIRLPTQRILADRLASLELEQASLRLELQSIRSQAGFAALSGPGIRIKMYDAVGGYTEDQIVHDADVRDVINELTSAGAAGVAVGDQRIVATSSIRCAGPVILINHRPVQVDPVIISAVGDPHILASSLNLIHSTLMATKGVKLELEKSDRLTLPAYTSPN